MRRFLIVACLLLTACGGTTATDGSTPTPKPTPIPTPLPPDTETISQGATGYGVYQLITAPVVIIHNDATRHSALGVAVHFTLTHSGRALDAVDAPPFDLAPGETLAVAGYCTDTCTATNGFTATVTPASWGTPQQAPVITATAPTLSGGGGRGQADAGATLSGTGIAKGTLITGFAACYAPGGGIVGGGLSTFSWAGAPTQSASVPVIVSSTVAHCDVYAALGA